MYNVWVSARVQVFAQVDAECKEDAVDLVVGKILDSADFVKFDLIDSDVSDVR